MFTENQRKHLRRLERLATIPVSTVDVYDLLGKWTDVTPNDVEDIRYGKKPEEISTRKSNIIEGLLNSWNIESKELGTNGFALHNMTTHYFSNQRGRGDTDLLFGDFGRKEKQTIQFAENLPH